MQDESAKATRNSGDGTSCGATTALATRRSAPLFDAVHALLPSSSCSGAASEDLWAQALQTLSSNEHATLCDELNAANTPTQDAAGFGPPPPPTSLPDVLEQLCRAAARKKAECDARRWRFVLRGRTYILRDVADKVIVWANLFKQVGDVAVQHDPGHASLPWAAVRFLLEAVTADSRIMGALLMSADLAAHLTGRCRIYEYLYLRNCDGGGGGGGRSDSTVADQAARCATENELKAALAALYAAILRLLALAMHLYGKGTATRALHALVDPNSVLDRAAECQTLAARVDVAASNCERACSIARDAALQALLSAYAAPIVRADARVAQLWARASDARRSEVMYWASRVPYEQAHRSARVGRTPDTGLWLLAHERFREWRSSSASMILWLHGIPGAGKTKLASMVVDHLLETFQRSQGDEALAYFYCDRNIAERQDPVSILRSFVLQLSTSSSGDDVHPCLVEVYERKKRKGPADPELSESDCVELLHTLVDIYPQTTIVLDALDEANRDRRASLIDVLDSLVASSSKLVKVLISSRRDADIKRQYEAGPNVAIEATDNAHDISTFVTAELALYEKRRRRKLPPALRQDIVRVLQEKSNGMFQWAALQIAQLLKLDRERDMRRRLGQLPLGLQTAYDELHAQIQRQEGSGAEVAERAFKWVMCAWQPLTTAELLGAVCQNPDDDDGRDAAGVCAVDIDADFVLGACRNLLVVDAHADRWKFAHLSVQEYFEDLHRVRRQPEWSLCSAHALAAKVCLLLLNDAAERGGVARVNNGDLATSSSSSSSDSSGALDAFGYDASESVSRDADLLSLGPILTYAQANWLYHIYRHSEERIDPRAFVLLKQFLSAMHESGLPYPKVLAGRKAE